MLLYLIYLFIPVAAGCETAWAQCWEMVIFQWYGPLNCKKSHCVEFRMNVQQIQSIWHRPQSQNLQILIVTLCSLALFFDDWHVLYSSVEMQQWQLLFLSGLYFLNLHEATGTFHLILWGRAVCRQGLYPAGRWHCGRKTKWDSALFLGVGQLGLADHCV